MYNRRPPVPLAVFIAGVALVLGLLVGPGIAQTNITQNVPITGIVMDHVTLSVESLDHESDWYERVMGFKVTKRSSPSADMLTRQLRVPGFRIDLIQYKGSTRPATVVPPYLRQGWVHIAFSVPDLEDALKQLRALEPDVTIGSRDGAGVPTRLVVHDPEGNEIELFGRQ